MGHPKVLFICSAQSDYPRNTQILRALKMNFEVIPITSNKPSYYQRLPEVILKLFWISFIKKYDLIYCGFLGQPLMPFIGLIRLFKKKPVILDAFISIYDTLCLDRKDFKTNSTIGTVSYWLDSFSLRQAESIITDTQAHTDYFSGLFHTPREKCITLYTGIDETILPEKRISKNEKNFIVFSHGNFLPLHGNEYIVTAAKLLENQPEILFKMVGAGREKNKIVRLSRELKVKNIEFIDWVSYEDLFLHISEADLCLGGHFSDNPKAKRVISGKTFLYLAMHKPVIVGNSPAAQELFAHGENIFMCPMADAQSLADAILQLKHDTALREKIAQGGYEVFKTKCSNVQIAEQLAKIVGKSVRL